MLSCFKEEAYKRDKGALNKKIIIIIFNACLRKKHKKDWDIEAAAAVGTPSLSCDGQYWYCIESGYISAVAFLFQKTKKKSAWNNIISHQTESEIPSVQISCFKMRKEIKL